MKQSYRKAIGSAAALAMLASGALLIGVADASAQRSPTGLTWDCLINGSQGAGVAYITFNEDLTFSGISIMTPNKPVPPSGDDDVDPRTGGVEYGRSDATSSSSAAVVYGSSQNIYGFGPIEGQWNFDERGRVVGYFVQVIGNSSSTNAATTNMIGFRATVTPFVRLTLTAFTPNGGRSVYRGIAMRELPDLSGSWYGFQANSTEKLVEFFDLAPSFQYGAYTSTGTGAGYDTLGWVIVSARNRIGFAALCGDKLRSTVGTFNRRSGLATTKGVIEPGTRLRFNAYHYPVLTTAY